ncbi:MAG TPA: class I adenylate-forming enzyme family protein, partial [Candidatus Binatia bacterium]
MNKGQLFPLLERAAKNWPSDIAIVRGANHFSFLQLKIAAEALASKLLAAGIKPGYKVGLLCPNGPEYVVGSFALFLINVVVVPIFPGLKKREVTELAGEMELDGYCYSPQYESQIPARDKNDFITANFEGQLEFHIQLAYQQDRPEADGDKLLRLGAPLLRFTSGTTSLSKGVIIPQTSMLEYTKRFISVYSIEKGDCILNLLSMAHIFYQITTGFMRGVKILVEEATRIDAIIEMIREHRVTHIEAAPTFYSMLLAYEKISPDDFRRIRYLTSCGAPLPDNVAGAFRERFGREIVQRYGLTETGPVLVNLSEDVSKRGSLGTAAPGCEIRLDNPTDSAVADFGEIIVRCPGLFAGYYRPWMAKDTLLKSGWFHTGDLARCDRDGYYWLVGRTKTIINVGAVKVFPDEIEDLLLTHPAIEEAVVFGAPDQRFGEAPHAKVKLATGSNCTQRELLRYANKNLSLFKALRRIEVVDAIPKTVTGKT